MSHTLWQQLAVCKLDLGGQTLGATVTYIIRRHVVKPIALCRYKCVPSVMSLALQVHLHITVKPQKDTFKFEDVLLPSRHANFKPIDEDIIQNNATAQLYMSSCVWENALPCSLCHSTVWSDSKNTLQAIESKPLAKQRLAHPCHVIQAHFETKSEPFCHVIYHRQTLKCSLKIAA